MGNERQKRNAPVRFRIALILSLTLLAAGAALLSLRRAAGVETLTVRFLDVGQADSCLITCGGESVLIDGGNRDDSALLYSVLEREGIDRLRAVINTHPDEDHIGGLTAALSRCSVGAVYCSADHGESEWFADFERLTEANGVKIQVPRAGERIRLSDAELTFLNTPGAFGDVNEDSIVLRVDHVGNSFLFMGDAGVLSETDLIERHTVLTADVIKVGHHGSESATGEELLRTVSPRYAVISVGAGNTYGFPRAEVLGRLHSAGCEVLRTDRMGEITFVSDGTKLTFSAKRAYDEAESLRSPGEESPSGIPAGVRYIGSLNGNKYHRPDCKTLPKEKNRVYFLSREEAEAQGYLPCGKCDP